jgi:hypothetical protein
VLVGSLGLSHDGALVVDVDNGGTSWRYSVVSVHDGEVLRTLSGFGSRNDAASAGMRAAYLVRDQMACDQC